MRYYKITNPEENHFGLQYKDGLNVDLLPFNPSGDCEFGGIYFSREDILAFLGYGSWLREVTIPEGELIYENSGEPKKWKAHQVILGPRREINLNVIKELIEEGANPKAQGSHAIVWAAQKGHLEVIKYLVSIGCDPKARDNYAIKCAAADGHLEVVKYLISLGCDPEAQETNNFLSELNNYAIINAARNGHLEVVKYLVSIGCDPKAQDNYAIIWAAESGHLEVIKYLVNL
jgi:ankyrin repeat protein